MKRKRLLTLLQIFICGIVLMIGFYLLMNFRGLAIGFLIMLFAIVSYLYLSLVLEESRKAK